MADRIDKISSNEAWRVQETKDSRKNSEEQNQDQNQQSKDQDQFEHLHDKTDWNLLLEKSRLWKKNYQIPLSDIDQVIFRKVNLKTDPSLLRIEVHTNSGEIIDPAFIAIDRMNALKIKNLESGNPMNLDLITKDTILRITVPRDPAPFEANIQSTVRESVIEKDETTVVKDPSKKSLQQTKLTPWSKWNMESILLGFCILFFVMLIVGGLLFL